MMEEYGIIKQKKSQFPVRELLVVPHQGKKLTVSYPAFGPNNHEENLKDMRKTYSHPITGKEINFRPATTSESISAVAYEFGNMAKTKIFDPRWLQAGYIVRTQDGVFTNTIMTDKDKLKQILNYAKKVNRIYLLDNGMGFAPYDSFKTGVQDINTFVEGGLARVLEHTTKKTATKLKEIGSEKNYKKGVNVWGFDISQKPIIRVAGLGSGRGIGGWLSVDGSDLDVSDGGYAFGVLKKSRGDAPKK